MRWNEWMDGRMDGWLRQLIVGSVDCWIVGLTEERRNEGSEVDVSDRHTRASKKSDTSGSVSHFCASASALDESTGKRRMKARGGW